jgi:DNA-binding FadR family transcriptional regulator
VPAARTTSLKPAGAPPENGARTGKLAAIVASRIVDDVFAREWPVGEVIGSEAELLARYGVSRAVFREAVRLVEHQHVARMRRGPGGGLVVTEPDVNAVIDAAVMYLLRVRARLDEVFEARIIIEEIVTELAAKRVDENGLARIRALIDDEARGSAIDHRALHTLLAQTTRNPVLELFVDMLNRVAAFYFSDRQALGSDTLSAAAQAHKRIAEAVLAGDDGLAKHRMRTHLTAEAEYIRGGRGARQILKPSDALRGPAGSKRAEAVARDIFGAIVTGRFEPGDFLGSEADLLEEHGVSRAVLREAVRILEYHHVAAMRRGPGGGLFVVSPSVAPVADGAAVYLKRRGVQVAHFGEVRVGVELALGDLVIDGRNAGVEATLRASLAAEENATDAQMVEMVHDLHASIASLSGNRALELIGRVLIRLTRLQEAERPQRARAQIRAEIHRAHSGIADALVAGDRELAHHRMRRHLNAVASSLQQ